MDRTRTLFMAIMCLTGLALAAAVTAWPSLRSGPAPALFWIVLVVFLFDAVAIGLGARLGLTRITPGLRLAGLVSGAIVYLLADLALTTLKAPLA